MTNSVLLLDIGYTPVHVVSIARAFCLVFAEKAEVVEEDPEDVWRSPSRQFPVPKVIRLLKSVKIPYKTRLPLTKRAVLARDKSICAYCGGHATTIDHVVPKARLGSRAHRWENVVASCAPCNHKKGEKSLEQMGWSLSFKPYAPTGTRWLVLGIAKDPTWEPYLVPA